MIKQPKPFYMIFFVEMWERFGFYGMQAIMTLYLVQRMGFSDAESFNVWSAFSALIYAVIAIGGYVGDHILGTKRTLLLGAIFLAIGYSIVGLHNIQAMYYGMGMIVAGNCFFKANPSSLLSKCYEENDPRLDGAFTLYYMAINIGSFFSMVLSPVVASHYGWRAGFSMSSAGLVIGILNYYFFRKTVKNVDSEPGMHPMNFLNFIIVVIGGLLLAAVTSYILRYIIIAHIALIAVGLLILFFFFKEILRVHGAARSRLIAALILILQGLVFFLLYQQMPTSLNFYAINNVQHSILGFVVNPLSFQALNGFWIFVMSPLLAWIYTKLGQRNADLSMPAKFTFGMLLCAISFIMLYFSRFFGNAQGIVSSWWIIGSYFFQSTGELLVSGLGLAMVAHLVPQRMMGFIMGAWFMGAATGMILGGFVAGMTSITTSAIGVLSLDLYTSVFLKIGLVTLLITCLMGALIPTLKRMMQ